MKTLIGVLFGLYFGLLSYPVYSATVFTPIDGDVDGIIIEGALSDGQFLALTRPNELPGAFWSLALDDFLEAEEVISEDIITSVLGTPDFSLALWDSNDWHFANTVTPVGSDAALLEWVFDHGVITSESVKLLAVDVEVSAIPVPPAAWLFGSGLLGMVGVARRGHLN